MMDEEIRQALTEVREMKKMCGNINMKLTNIVTQRGQDIQKKLDAEYQRGREEGKAQSERGCEGCKYGGTPQGSSPCYNCSNYYQNNWMAKDDEIRIGDEVVGTAGHRGFVTKPINSESVYVMWEDGSCGANDLKDLKKTGRTRYDIEMILEAMKEHD